MSSARILFRFILTLPSIVSSASAQYAHVKCYNFMRVICPLRLQRIEFGFCAHGSRFLCSDKFRYLGKLVVDRCNVFDRFFVFLEGTCLFFIYLVIFFIISGTNFPFSRFFLFFFCPRQSFALSVFYCFTFRCRVSFGFSANFFCVFRPIFVNR